MQFEQVLEEFSQSREKVLEECEEYLAGLERKLGEFTGFSEHGINPSPKVSGIRLFIENSNLENLIELSVAYYDDNQKIDRRVLKSSGIDITKVESDDLIYPFSDAKGNELAKARKYLARSISPIKDELVFSILPKQFFEKYYSVEMPLILEPLISVRTVDALGRGYACSNLEFFEMVINHELTHIHATKELGLKDWTKLGFSDYLSSVDKDQYMVVLEAAGMATTKARVPEYIEDLEKSGKYGDQSQKEILELAELIFDYCQAESAEKTISNIRKEQILLANKAKKAENINQIKSLLIDQK